MDARPFFAAQCTQPSEPSEVQQGGEEEPGTTQGRSVSDGEENHNPLPSDVAGYDSDENPYNNDDGVRYISDQFLEDMRQETAEELRRERYPHEELAEVSDPDLWMELHHHDYDYDSESISETQEPQGAASQEGTLTVSSNRHMWCGQTRRKVSGQPRRAGSPASCVNLSLNLQTATAERRPSLEEKSPTRHL